MTYTVKFKKVIYYFDAKLHSSSMQAACYLAFQNLGLEFCICLAQHEIHLQTLLSILYKRKALIR